MRITGTHRRERKRRAVSRSSCAFRRARAAAGCARGSALIETALVLPMLLVVMSGVFEFGRMFHIRLTARHAVIEATRYAVTGNFLTDPETGDPIDRATSIRRIVAERAYTLPVVADAIIIDPPDGGGPEDVVRVTLHYTYQYTMPGFMDVLPDMRFSVAAAMKNEPYFRAAP